ncbi:hypothetical protein BGZ93_004247 [Podila epicladia]|nr:hypothetical protein BGZ93_004247 [Podila epicladia]
MAKDAPTQDNANASRSTQVTKTNIEPYSAPNPGKVDPHTTTHSFSNCCETSTMWPDALIFDGAKFYCHQHGYIIQNEWRYQYLGSKKDGSRRCDIYSYRILHTDTDERTYRCQYYIHNESGHLFRAQAPISTSRDFTTSY